MISLGKSLCCGVLFLMLTMDCFAEDTIKITVHSNEQNVAAIGFRVSGRDYGSLGNTYTTRGPKGKTYFFGIKKDSIFGVKVSCGNLNLDNDSSVTLVYQDNTCICTED